MRTEQRANKPKQTNKQTNRRLDSSPLFRANSTHRSKNKSHHDDDDDVTAIVVLLHTYHVAVFLPCMNSLCMCAFASKKGDKKDEGRPEAR